MANYTYQELKETAAEWSEIAKEAVTVKETAGGLYTYCKTEAAARSLAAQKSGEKSIVNFSEFEDAWRFYLVTANLKKTKSEVWQSRYQRRYKPF